MKKKFLIIVLIIIFIGVFFLLDYFGKKKEKIPESFIQCLADTGVTIYGTEVCPVCKDLVESFSGYEKINPIYVNCTKEMNRCEEEICTGFVPEVQIKGELYNGLIDPQSLGQAVGCEL